MNAPEVARGLGIHKVGQYRRRKEYGGMGVDQMKRLRQLEQENVRLREAVSKPSHLTAAFRRRPPAPETHMLIPAVAFTGGNRLDWIWKLASRGCVKFCV
jgi:hypothetical protein